MFDSAYYNASSGVIKRCDLTHLANASRLLCGMELNENHTFINPVTLEPIQIDQENYDYCYRSVYAGALLESLNVKKGDIQVEKKTYFKVVLMLKLFFFFRLNLKQKLTM
jgi:hypothetical protein